MRLIVYPLPDPERLPSLAEAASPMEVTVARDAAQAVRLMESADAFYGKLTPSLLAAARQLRWVQCPTVSLEHYLFPELVEHPCVLTNMRGLYGDVVADHAWALILAAARNLHQYVRRQIQHRWEPVGGAPGATPELAIGVASQSPMDLAHLHLSDQTIGIVGLGDIGRHVAARGAAFGCRIVAVDPNVRHPPAGVSWVRPPEEIEVLLSQSDFVVIAAPHTPRTSGWFNRDRLGVMKSTAWLLNVGRGAIVPLDDLRDALQARTIAGAALDVLAIEPLPEDDLLWDMPNVIITPHVAACSPRIAERHWQTLWENARRFVNGWPLLHVVDKRQGY